MAFIGRNMLHVIDNKIVSNDWAEIDSISPFITADKQEIMMRSEMGQDGFQCEYDHESYGFTGTGNMNNSASIRPLRWAWRPWS